jgi:hypothetical protein
VAILAILSILAIHRINNLPGFNTAGQFNSRRLHQKSYSFEFWVSTRTHTEIENIFRPRLTERAEPDGLAKPPREHNLPR